jgi:hypothetical protein
MTTKETLDKAYGNMPKEPTPNFDLFDWLPTWRGIRYYWFKVVRKFTR